MLRIGAMCDIDEFWVGRGLHEAIDHFQSDLNTLHERIDERFFVTSQHGGRPTAFDAVRFQWRHVNGDTGAESALFAASSNSHAPTSQACAPA